MIRTLLESEQRLEVLTGGEVDAVADRDGRIFLLRRAQDQLRHNEAAKQAAILDALPAHIALLDPQGVIISVNEAWRGFSGVNVLQGPEYGVGVNYLDVCDRAQGNDASEAEQVSAGIRSVLNGSKRIFSLEYTCHSPAEQRWFLMTVTPLADDPPHGVVVMHLDITAQKLVKEELRESQRRFSDMLAHVQMMSLMLDPEGNITYCNDYLLQLTGWRREEVMGRNWFELFIPPETRDLWNVRTSLLAGNEAARHHENEILTHSGERKFIRWHNTVLRSLAGEVIGTAGLGEDITESRKIEAEVRETKNFLTSIFENIPHSIFIKDARDLRYVRVNPACERQSGYSSTEMVGRSDRDLFPQAQADQFIAKDRETIASNQQVFIVEETITSKDGAIKTLRTKKFPILDHAGHPQYLLGMSEDITESNRAHELVRKSEARFRGFVEHSPDAMLIHQDGLIVFVNENMVRLLRAKDAGALVGRAGLSLVHPASRDVSEQRRSRLYSGEAVPLIDLVYLRADGTPVDVEVASAPINLEGHPAALVVVRDITGRKEQERKIAGLNRIRAVLSGINQAIVRIRDRRELFQEACRIIVEHGRFTLGWIAILDHATGKVAALAHAGLPENFDADNAIFNGEVGLVPAGIATTAVGEQRFTFDNAIEDIAESIDAKLEPDTLKVRRAAIALGAKSVIVLPLVVEKETYGFLTLYAPEKNFFDGEEIKLLIELAGDISFNLEYIAKEEKVNYLAYYDVLTGLANRTLFLERLTQYMRSAERSGHQLALFLFDLERFKNINDSFGRSTGDALLKQVAEWLKLKLGDANLFARVGADHFAIMLPVVARDGNLAGLVDKSMEAFVRHTFRLDDAALRIAAKVGIAIFPDDALDAEMLLGNAEAALKNAKASGAPRLFYARAMNERVAEKTLLEHRLRQAIDKKEFVLHYQPKINLASGKLTGVEALIRWNDPQTGLVPPARFIPILEETGLIYEVGRWALHKATDDYLRWLTLGLQPVRVAVNVSPLQLRRRDFVSEVVHAVGVNAHVAAGLELEITESVVMEDVHHSIDTLQKIRDLGIRIAIDDFGTGFSSLSYLSKLPVDTLKIDRSFVTDMTVSEEGLALVATIINLAHSLKLKVVAEGVETEEQARLLRSLECDEMQGYLFSKPVPRDIFESKFLALGTKRKTPV